MKKIEMPRFQTVFQLLGAIGVPKEGPLERRRVPDKPESRSGMNVQIPSSRPR